MAKQNKKINLKDTLVLNKYLLNLFGADSFEEFSKDLKSISLEGFDENNVSKYYYLILNKLLENNLISKESLLEYDQNIVRYTLQISEKQSNPITWKYFQFLSLLFTEIYLDLYFSNSKSLLNILNDFSEETFKNTIEIYSETDLNKLAFWNATGSGKTLIMHVNILQYKFYAEKYNKLKDINRIILLTPNEGLSKQHLIELNKSGFIAELFNKQQTGLFSDGIIEIIDIHKLEDSEGEKTVAVESFENNNLVLVDEGHRGASGDDWKVKRDKLSELGFSFEYSATFGQAVSAANGSKKNDLLNEYSKCTLFDYSYKYFYEDGYGKNYHILNLNDTWNEITVDEYFTACLLNYYQQVKVYNRENISLRQFLIEKPLFIFVGSKVTAVRTENKQKVSDVVRVLQFFKEFIRNKNKSLSSIEKLLTGMDGLVDKNNTSIFRNSFNYINSLCLTPSEVYDDLLNQVFNSSISGAELHLDNLKGVDGEIGMRVGDSEYFGVINVGDDSTLLKLCEESGFLTTEKDFSDSLFHKINNPNSKINLLIGSKKFSEGWNSWRVSTMGLMNVGRGEGTEIIQLFGRGVRLKGYNFSLKRSDKLDKEIKPRNINKNIKYLETLYIFGIRADYMQQFKEYLEEEGLPTGDLDTEQIDLPILPAVELIEKNKLKVLKVKEGTDFKKAIQFVLPEEILSNINIELDWYPKIQILNRSKNNITNIDNRENGKLSKHNLAFIDWDKVYFEIRKFKNERNWYNISVTRDTLKEILYNNDWYTLYIPRYELSCKDFEQTKIWQDIAISLLKLYVDKYYNIQKGKYLSKHLEYEILTPEHPNFIQEYKLYIEKTETDLIQNIHRVKRDLENKDLKGKYSFDQVYIINFTQHLYKPLIHFKANQQGEKIKVVPTALNEGEMEFITSLKTFYDKNTNYFNDKELFLLRNLSRKGIGFFEANNFYPDFIMWIINNDKQYVNFIDPKGLRQINGFENLKIKFHKTIKEIEEKINDKNIILNSFIITPTRHEEIKHWQDGQTITNFAQHNVYFQKDDKDYIKNILDKIIN